MYSELKARIALAKEIAAAGCYSDRLLEVLGQISIGYATTIIDLSLKATFRARVISDDLSLTHLEQVWHPKPFQIQKFGRANLPFVPVLYCSDDPNTAIKEAGGKAGDRVAVMEMGLAEHNARLQVFSLGELRARKKTKKGVMGPELDTMLAKMWAMKIDMQRAMLIDGFYADVFRTPGPEFYILTAAITQAFMAPDQIDGISYPTVATPIGQNLALKPISAARLLAVRSVKITRLIKPLRDTFFARDEKISRFLHPDGRIEWH